MDKKVFIAISIFIVLSAGAYFYFTGTEYVVRMSESEIREKLDKKLPLTKSYFFIIQITLKNPRVMLEERSKRVKAGLDILLNIKINKNPKPLGGTIDVSGGVKYLAEKGEFFLTDPIIENLGVQGIPNKYLDKVNKALTQLLTKYYESNPIYTLHLSDSKQAIARMALKDVAVVNKELVVTLGI